MADVFILGVTTMDFAFYVDAFPTRAEKYRAGGAEIVGGGCAANAAVAVTRLGGRAHLGARLGDDPVAAMIVHDLAAEGVKTDLVQRFPGARSSCSSVLIDAAGERQIVNFRGSGLPEDPGWIALPAGTGAVLTDTRWPKGARRAMDLARAAGVPGIIDAEAPFQAEDLASASHVTFSAQGLAWWHPDLPLSQALGRAARDLGRWVCVTDGAHGVWYDGPDGAGHVPAFKVPAVDTLGAGDTWHGAFALTLAEGADTVPAIHFANAAAAIKCTRRGGRSGAPTRPEVETFLKEHGHAVVAG